MVETIQGEAACRWYPGFHHRPAQGVRRAGLLLVLDEVQCGYAARQDVGL